MEIIIAKNAPKLSNLKPTFEKTEPILKTISQAPNKKALIEANIINALPKTADKEIAFNFNVCCLKHNCNIAPKTKIAIPIKYNSIIPL